MQGRNDVVRRTQKPLRLIGDVSMTEGRIAIDALNAEIDGGTIEGRVALSAPRPPRGTRLEAALKAERLDLDAAGAFIRSLAGPDADWPDEAAVSLDIGRAVSAGQELKPFTAKFGYSPKTLMLDQLKFGQPGGVTVRRLRQFRSRRMPPGKLALNATPASLGQFTAMIAPLAPPLASRLDAGRNRSGTGAR